ncbi:unnamed protein product [Gadus morhua 'NCC']
MAIISSTTPWTVLQTVDRGIPKASAVTLYDAPQASQYIATSTSTSWLHPWAFCRGSKASSRLKLSLESLRAGFRSPPEKNKARMGTVMFSCVYSCELLWSWYQTKKINIFLYANG